MKTFYKYILLPDKPLDFDYAMKIVETSWNELAEIVADIFRKCNIHHLFMPDHITAENIKDTWRMLFAQAWADKLRNQEIPTITRSTKDLYVTISEDWGNRLYIELGAEIYIGITLQQGGTA